ncbi:MAG: hypothetical protein RSE13_00215 [Planktothrix sp. GU0601_MAG3]|nr:MAG: hypothetical protein RSE13_00215 [Planktothrix sp. GU0601_MAG3]
MILESQGGYGQRPHPRIVNSQRSTLNKSFDTSDAEFGENGGDGDPRPIELGHLLPYLDHILSETPQSNFKLTNTR